MKLSDKNEIIKLCKDESINYDTIASWFGVRREQVSNICREAGTHRPRGKHQTSTKALLSIDERNQIIELCKDKSLKKSEIAKWFGVSQSYIYSICSESAVHRLTRKKKRTGGRKKRTVTMRLTGEDMYNYSDILWWRTRNNLSEKEASLLLGISLKKLKPRAKFTREENARIKDYLESYEETVFPTINFPDEQTRSESGQRAPEEFIGPRDVLVKLRVI